MTTDRTLRISDADRTTVADRLAQHYADGRLDRSEFDGRLERALAAKTVADLDGLFDGLPGGHPGQPPEPFPRTGAEQAVVPVRRHRRPPRPLVLVLIVLIAAAVGHALAHAALLWPLIVIAAFVWIRRHRHRRL